MKIKGKKDRNLTPRDGKWYLDFTFRGKRVRQFGGYTKDQARNVLARLRIEKLDERLGFSRPAAPDPIPFDKFAADFLELYAKQNKRSWRRDELSLKSLGAFFKGETLQSLGAEKVEAFKAKRRTEVSDATVNRELACLKTLFNKAVEWGKIEANPTARVKKFKENPGREWILTAAEAHRLIEASSPGLRPVLIVALNTGMRRNEILSLKWQSLDFGRGFILIENSKSGKPRKVPMNAAVEEVLRALPRSAEYVFYNPGTKSYVRDVKRAFAGARERAGIKGLRLHDLRHTAASKMIEAGVDLVTVSKILGHASIQMTMRYAHPTPENMKLAVLKLGEALDPTRQKVDSVIIPRPVKDVIHYH